MLHLPSRLSTETGLPSSTRSSAASPPGITMQRYSPSTWAMPREHSMNSSPPAARGMRSTRRPSTFSTGPWRDVKSSSMEESRRRFRGRTEMGVEIRGPVSRPWSDAELFDFLVVVLAIENVPLLAAFGDDAALGFDFLAGGRVDSHFLQKKGLEGFAGFLVDGVAVFEEVAFRGFREGVGDNVGQFIEFVAGDSHSTALYLRASSVLTFLNISE